MYYHGCKTNRNLNDVFENIGRGIVNFDPVKGLNYLNNNFSDIFNGMGEAFSSTNSVLSVKLDILEDDNIYEVVVELAGINKEDVKILAKDEDSIEIKAIRKEPEFADNSNKRFIHQERRFGDVIRTISFPKQIDKDGISAKWQNGELLITIPKMKAAEPKEIVITAE
jgi:HSP20 family protein